MPPFGGIYVLDYKLPLTSVRGMPNEGFNKINIFPLFGVPTKQLPPKF
jgi:hypothetical protein